LWCMRASAKLNLFLGVRNLGLEFLPSHLNYLQHYFRKAPMNLLMPWSISLATAVVVWLVMGAMHAEPGSASAIGKLLVATSNEELPVLEKYRAQAAINGVVLEPLDAAGVGRMEPAVRAVAGLWSPSTGIIDSHGLMLALLGDAEAAGAMLVTHTPVLSVSAAPSEGKTEGAPGFVLDCGGASPMRMGCRLLVNAAGHAAQRLARDLVGPVPAHFAKGHYFTLSGRSPFSHLVYPMPNSAGLGIHVTLDLAGRCRFGPDVTRWLSTEPLAGDYAFEEGLREVFAQAIRRYWPELDSDRLQPGYTGIRPKVSGPGEAAGDFVIQGPQTHGRAGLVNLFGIESPGLTSSLAVARAVLELLELSTGAADDF
ncbi:MAG: FAD-dependent oxidoreductase, partial [Burkholderiaceae bacterium]